MIHSQISSGNSIIPGRRGEFEAFDTDSVGRERCCCELSSSLLGVISFAGIVPSGSDICGSRCWPSCLAAPWLSGFAADMILGTGSGYKFWFFQVSVVSRVVVVGKWKSIRSFVDWRELRPCGQQVLATHVHVTRHEITFY